MNKFQTFFTKTITKFSASVLALSLLVPSMVAPLQVNAVTPTTVFVMGDLGGGFSQGLGINASGQVVGYSYLPNQVGHGFIWSSGSGMTDLGSFSGGSSDSNLDASVANAVNDSGQAVGYSTSTNANHDVHAFIWESGSGLTDIGVTAGAVRSEAVSINNSGQVVGVLKDAGGGLLTSGFLWQNGSFTTLPFNPADINNLGDIVGTDITTGTVVKRSADGTITNLGTMGGTSAQAKAINNNGQIAGQVTNTGHSALFVWDPATGQRDMSAYDTSLALGSTQIFDMNDSMQVTGLAKSADPCATGHVFVWEPATGVTDIGTDGYVSQGRSINNNGQTTGYARVGTDQNTGQPCLTITAFGASSATTSSTTFAAASTTAATSTNNDQSTLWSGNKPVARTISVGSASVVRSMSGKPSKTIRFPVTLSVPSTTPVKVNWAIAADGTATAATPTTDFAVKKGTATFGVNSQTGYTKTTLWIATTVTGSAATDTKTFKITLTPNSAASGYTIPANAATGTGTIFPSDSGIVASVTTTPVWEGDHGVNNAAEIRVELSSPATTTVKVQLKLTNGTAIGGVDYKTFTTKTISFSAGQHQKSVLVPIKSNLITGPAYKTFTATITSAAGSYFVPISGSHGTSTFIIIDND